MKLTIIVPTHNRPEFIKEKVEAFRDIDSLEVIYIENNSNKENIKLYKKIVLPKNQKMFFLSEPRFILGKARNFGVLKAKGEYIYFLDDDDTITKEFLEGILKGKKITKNVYRFYQDVQGKKVKPGLLFNVGKFSKFDLVNAGSYLIRREYIIENQLFFIESTIAEDNFFASMIYKSISKQKIVPIISFLHNKDTISITRTTQKNSYEYLLDPLKLGEKLDKNKYDHSYKFVLFYGGVGKNKGNFLEDEQAVEALLLKYFKEKIEDRSIYRNVPLQYKIKYLKLKKLSKKL